MDLPECGSAEGFTNFSLREGRRLCDGEGVELSEQGLQSLCTYSSHDSLLSHEAVDLDLLFFKINESSLEVSVETRSRDH